MDSQLLKKLILIASAFIVIDRNVELLSARVDITTLTDEGQVYGWGRGDSWEDSMGYPTLIIIFASIPIFAIAVCILDHFSLIPMYGITVATLGMLNTLASGCGLSNLMRVNAVLHNAFLALCADVSYLDEAVKNFEVIKNSGQLNRSSWIRCFDGGGFVIVQVALVSWASYCHEQQGPAWETDALDQ
ncbi:hypothetical protein I3842_08G147800 [Carya illinoinensis]|uniref:Uncharacterized protein n=1 Tax=Carya illinoinensis TaxID=32201 RepID=A0A922ECJ5_CARIL|nr:hypothetical protein I3842_08G147800 [Carya illinoinensis]